MFFNVHSREVEDWTRHGLSDLAAKIARTPLPPRQTFLDDPLRVLRTVRFASRFDLTIEPAAAAAIREDDIQLALRTKVSRERVGIETTKMMHNNPVQSLELIEGLHLHSAMFAAPVSAPHPHEQAVYAARILERVVARGAGEPSDALWLAAAVCPYRGARVERKKKDESVVSVIMAESLKLSTEQKLAVSNLFEATPLLDPTLTGRARIGVTLQHPSVRPWEQSLVWAIVERVLPTWAGEWTPEHETIFTQFMAFKDHIVELGLPEAIKQPPLLDVSASHPTKLTAQGRKLQQLLSIRPGPLLAVLAREINSWQLDHPGATADDCEAWVLEMWNGPGRMQWEAAVPPPVVKTGKAEKRKQKAAAEAAEAQQKQGQKQQ
jgi:tRNA nucleotidyltransferase (CCA-adding enzyme)